MFRTRLHDDIYGVATSVSRGFFQNIGDTRRQGAELRFTWRAERWTAFLNYSLVQATFGILSDPTGIGAPGVPPGALSNGPGVDNRFQSPAAPLEAVVGVRLKL